MARDHDSGAAAAALAAGAGGTVLGTAALRPAVERAFLRHVTKGDSPYAPVMRTTVGPGLWNGSGEARMSVNLQRVLRRHGINSTYAPDPNRPVAGYETPIAVVPGKRVSGVPEALTSSQHWKGFKTNFDGKDVKLEGLESTLDNAFRNREMSGRARRRFLKRFYKNVNAGKFNGLSVARLRDMAKLDIDYLLHPERLGRAAPGQRKIFFNGFRGFRDTWKPGSITHAENWYSPTSYGGEVNLGRSANFMANYGKHTPNFIPGTTVYDPLLARTRLGARLQHRLDRKVLEKTIAGARATPGDVDKGLRGALDAVDLSGKKLVFVDSGSVGPNASQRIRDIVDAVKGRKDVHILFQHGRTTYAPDLYGENGVLPRLMKENPGLITPTTFVDQKLMNRLMSGADAHITYGGSSSAGEAGAHLTPTAFAQDGSLNLGNSKFVAGRRNAGGGMQVRHLDNITTAVDTELRDALAKRKGKPLDAGELNELLHGLTDRTRVDLGTPELANKLQGEILSNVAAATKANGGRPLSEAQLRKVIGSAPSGSPTVGKARALNKEIIDELLSDNARKQRFSTANLRSVRRYINDVHNADRNIAGVTKDLIFGLLNRDDLRGMRRTKADWRTLLRGTGSARMRALRRLASWKGLKNTNMSLGGLLAKGPIGRRFAAPGALAATALGGLGLKKLLSRD